MKGQGVGVAGSDEYSCNALVYMLYECIVWYGGRSRNYDKGGGMARVERQRTWGQVVMPSKAEKVVESCGC